MDASAAGPATQARTPAEALGVRLLKDIEREEGSLEDLLKDLRALCAPQISKTGIPSLDALVPTNIKTTTISGRHLPLLYHILQHMILTLHGTVCLLDLTSTFSPSHLCMPREDMRHIHVFFPTKASLALTLNNLERYMLYDEGSRMSRGREWVATIVLGGFGGDFAFGWKGVLRVQADEVLGNAGFGAAISVEEAVVERRRRKDAASVLPEDEGPGEERKKWKVVGENGSYAWSDA